MINIAMYTDCYHTGCLQESIAQAYVLGKEPALVARYVDQSYQLWFGLASAGRYEPDTLRQLVAPGGGFEIRKQHRAIYRYASKHSIPRNNVFFLEAC